jgi:opacity protein-like surface antigen
MKRILRGNLNRSVAMVATSLFFAGMAQAADIGAPASPSNWLSIDGGYVFGHGGTGMLSGNGVLGTSRVRPGNGVWVAGDIGFGLSNGWDIAAGADYADLGRGKRIGAGANIFGIDDTKMFSVDLEAGYRMPSGSTELRPFLGVRYLNFTQDTGYHPDVPLGCCSMDSKYNGFGPRIGIDATFAVSDPVSLTAGVDASIVFGKLKYNGGTSYVPRSGSHSSTATTFGGYIGANYAVSQNVSLGLKYRVEVLHGASFSNAGLFVGASGKATRVLHSPTVNLTFKF